MAYTYVTKLNTERAIKEFCDCLLQLKDLAPKSLSYTIAVTAHRNTTTRELKHGRTKEAEECIKRSFDNFERKNNKAL
jgi:hypothetical protein